MAASSHNIDNNEKDDECDNTQYCNQYEVLELSILAIDGELQLYRRINGRLQFNQYGVSGLFNVVGLKDWSEGYLLGLQYDSIEETPIFIKLSGRVLKGEQQIYKCGEWGGGGDCEFFDLSIYSIS